MNISTLALLERETLQRKLGGGLGAGVVATASSRDWLCLARGQRVALLRTRGGVAEFQAVDEDGQEGQGNVSCVEYVELPERKKEVAAGRRQQKQQQQLPPPGVFVCGTTGGWLRWYESDGHLIMAHRLHDSPVVRVRGFAVLFHKSVIVLLDQESVLAAIRAHAEPSDSAAPTLQYQKFELEGQRLINDLLTCAGTDVPDPWSAFHVARCKAHIVCGGGYPTLGIYVPLEHQGRLSTAVALASELTSKLTSAVFSMAKSWWSSGNETSPAPSPVKPPKIEEARGLDLEWELTDSTRELQSLALAPSGNLAAASDNLGRVLLIDLDLYIIVRLWKGYRDAQIAWIEQDDALFLVVYAPRRGIMEVWRMRHGQREAMIDVGTDCTLVRAGRCCYLLRPQGEVQRIQFSEELSNHLKSDLQTLEAIKAPARKVDADVLQLIRTMHHPKVLVQAVLALSKDDPSSLFLEAVTFALEQSGGGAIAEQQQQQPMLTPGAAAARVLSQDVTHLVWLDRFIRAYRAVEVKQPVMSCRQFLWCFSVHGASEARLTSGMTPDKRLQLAQFLFSASDFDSVNDALRWTRLASSDAETLLADVLLHGPFAHEASAIVSFARPKKMDFEGGGGGQPLLPVVWTRVCEATDLLKALRVASLVVQAFPNSAEWKTLQEQIDKLLEIDETHRNKTLSVAAALSGEFSLFKVIAEMEFKNESTDALAAAFPAHFERRWLISAHVCLEAMNAWSKRQAGGPSSALSLSSSLSSSRLNATMDDADGSEEEGDEADKGKEEGDYDDEDASGGMSEQSKLLSEASGAFLQQQHPLLAMQVWFAHLSSVFWRCASLVELARKTPSEHVVVKSLRMANLGEFRHFCTMARDCLKVVVDAWELKDGGKDDAALPFPSHPDAVYVTAAQEWKARTSEKLAELRSIHLLARAVCVVLKYGLRGVNVACVLPAESPLRDQISNDSKRKTRFGSIEFLRSVFVLKLLPANNNLAVGFAKTLDVNLTNVRKLAAVQL